MFLLLLALQQSVADSSPFRQLALPSPTPVRGATGGPGPRYWQQRADYTLEATLDTATNMLRGRGRIYYVNRSPETLNYVWLQLDQNIFAPPPQPDLPGAEPAAPPVRRRRGLRFHREGGRRRNHGRSPGRERPAAAH